MNRNKVIQKICRLVIQGLIPNALTWLFLLLFIGSQFFFVSSSGTFAEGKEITEISRFGIGSPIEIQYINHPNSVTVHWKAFLINIFTCYFLARLHGVFLYKITPWRHSLHVYSFTIIFLIILGFFGSIIMSKGYWGYFFSRPDIINELKIVGEVQKFVFVRTEATVSGSYQLVKNTDPPFYRKFINTTGEYYMLVERMLSALQERQLLPENPNTEDLVAPYSTLYQEILKSHLIITDGSGEELNGVIIITKTTNGSELIFFGATGGEVSNDHYPYYEMVFEKDSHTGQLHFLHGLRFFYDVAGLEGLEWYSVWPFLSIAGIVFVIPLVVLIAMIQYIRIKRKIAHRV